MLRNETVHLIARGFLYLALPIAVVMAAAVLARANWTTDVTWIGNGKQLQSQKLLNNLNELEGRLAAAEARLAGTAACPAGYEDKTNFCLKAADEMVKIGSGLSAFWIDRYEASVWSDAAGTTGQNIGLPFGVNGDDYPPTFPKNGQRKPTNANFAPLFAVSRKGVLPSGSITWFQAMEACAASGKRLPTGEEWLRAASGTNDPAGPNDGSKNTLCNTRTSLNNPPYARKTGDGLACTSHWGVQDMIGNLVEWTSEWYAGPPTTNGQANLRQPWPPGYGQDATQGVDSHAYDLSFAMQTQGLPAAALRGGSYSDGVGAGTFAFFGATAPTTGALQFGFRCVIR